MDWLFYLALFVGAGYLLYLSGELVVESLMYLARFLGLREFVVAFFVMAMAASLPNLLVGITSALAGIPELSLGDIFGNNLIALTLAVAVAVFCSAGRSIPVRGKIIRHTIWLTAAAAVLPILLLWDGQLSRGDGWFLIITFGFYAWWLLAREERFSKIYNHSPERLPPKLSSSFHALGRVLLGLIFLLLAAQGVVASAAFFAAALGLPLILIGLLVVGFGNALPEVYFAAISARRGETSLILGSLLGSVVVPATLVLGIVAVLAPINAMVLNSFVISRTFLLLAVSLFLLAARTGRRLVLWEAMILLLIYLGFVSVVIYF